MPDREEAMICEGCGRHAPVGTWGWRTTPQDDAGVSVDWCAMCDPDPTGPGERQPILCDACNVRPEFLGEHRCFGTWRPDHRGVERTCECSEPLCRIHRGELSHAEFLVENHDLLVKAGIVPVSTIPEEGESREQRKRSGLARGCPVGSDRMDRAVEAAKEAEGRLGAAAWDRVVRAMLEAALPVLEEETAARIEHLEAEIEWLWGNYEPEKLREPTRYTSVVDRLAAADRLAEAAEVRLRYLEGVDQPLGPTERALAVALAAYREGK